MCEKLKSNHQLKINIVLVIITILIVILLLVFRNNKIGDAVFIIYMLIMSMIMILKAKLPKDYNYAVNVTEDEIIFKKKFRKEKRISRNFRLFRNVVDDELVIVDACACAKNGKTKEVTLPYSEEIVQVLKKYSFWEIKEIQVIMKL